MATCTKQQIVILKKQLAAHKIYQASYIRRLDYIQKNAPVNDPIVDAWCADLSEGLTGEVETCEVYMNRQTYYQIRPAYSDGAAYNQARGGMLQYPVASSPEAVYFNRALLPAWQKWKPTYRHGKVTHKNDNGTVNIRLDGSYSTEQNLYIDDEQYFFNVPVEYMNCNSDAFDEGDDCLIEFINQDQENPVVIGFPDNPRRCYWEPWDDGRNAWDVLLYGSDDPGGVEQSAWSGSPIRNGASYCQMVNGRLQYNSESGYYQNFLYGFPPVLNDCKLKFKVNSASASGTDCEIHIGIGITGSSIFYRLYLAKQWKGKFLNPSIKSILLPGDPSTLSNYEYEISLNEYGIDYGSTVNQFYIANYSGTTGAYLGMDYLDVR